MYACIVIFVSTKLIDAILYGADAGTGKLFFVMSPKVRQMGQRVIGELERTVTYLDSHGGYTNEPGETMLCAVRRFEVYQLQNIIREEDKDAFVIVGEAGQITGEGFRSMHSDDKPVKELLKELRRAARTRNNKKGTPPHTWWRASLGSYSLQLPVGGCKGLVLAGLRLLVLAL